MRKFSKLTSLRLVALLLLPCFLGACWKWELQGMRGLRDAIREEQPGRIQLITRTEEVELSNPRVYGDAPMDTIGGILQIGAQVGIPFSEVVEASFQVEDGKSTARVLVGWFALIAAAFAFTSLPDVFEVK